MPLFLGGIESGKISGEPTETVTQRVVAENHCKSPRSTVGTSTEVYDYLRLLFARATDADSEDVLDLLAGDTLPLAGADTLGKGVHAVEDLVHVGDDVLAVDDELALLGCRAAVTFRRRGASKGCDHKSETGAERRASAKIRKLFVKYLIKSPL